MDGRATFTTVSSKKTMNCAAAKTASASQRRRLAESDRPLAASLGSWCALLAVSIASSP
jgi:hypothetical protein